MIASNSGTTSPSSIRIIATLLLNCANAVTSLSSMLAEHYSRRSRTSDEVRAMKNGLGGRFVINLMQHPVRLLYSPQQLAHWQQSVLQTSGGLFTRNGQ